MQIPMPSANNLHSTKCSPSNFIAFVEYFTQSKSLDAFKYYCVNCRYNFCII